MRIKSLVPLCGFVLLAGCNVDTYGPPKTLPHLVSVDLPGINKARIMAASRRALIANGYPIESFDVATGRIVSAPRAQSVGQNDADCGTNLTVDYLLDSRTTTQAAFIVTAQPGQLDVHAKFSARYNADAATPATVLYCVSRGTFEDEIIGAIRAQL